MLIKPLIIHNNYTIQYPNSLPNNVGLRLIPNPTNRTVILTPMNIKNMTRQTQNDNNIRKINPDNKKLSIGRIMDKMNWKIGDYLILQTKNPREQILKKIRIR